MCLCIVLSRYDLTAKVLQIESSYEVIIFEEIANGSVETAVWDHASTFERDKVIECCVRGSGVKCALPCVAWVSMGTWGSMRRPRSLLLGCILFVS